MTVKLTPLRGPQDVLASAGEFDNDFLGGPGDDRKRAHGNCNTTAAMGCLNPRLLLLMGFGVLLCGLACARQRSAAAEGAEVSSVWRVTVEVASGPAHRGPWRMNDSDYRWVDDPTVALASDGRVGVAWVDQTQKDVFFLYFSADLRERLAPSTNVSLTPETFSWLPRLVIAKGAADHVYVLWQEIVFSGGTHGGEVMFAVSRDGGRSFDAKVNLSQSVEGDGKGRLSERVWDNGSLDLARGPAGQLYAAWTEYEGALWLRRSTDDGRSFSRRLRLGGSKEHPARGPSLATAGDVVHVAWAVGESDSADIFLATSTDGGESFSPAESVLRSERYADAPKIAVDAEGTLHLAFSEAAGAGDEYRISYARRMRGASRFGQPRPLSAQRSHASARYPHLALGLQGRVHVLWEHYSQGARRPERLGFAFSVNGGEAFVPAGTVAQLAAPEGAFNGSLQGLLMSKLAADESGGVCAVNSTFSPEVRSAIRLTCGRVPETR